MRSHVAPVAATIRRSDAKRVLALVAVGAALVLAAPAAPAQADGFSLRLEPNSGAVVGRPLIINASGAIPPQDVGFPYYFSLDALPTTLTTTCPPDRWEGVQFAEGNGGSVVELAQNLHPDAAGTFDIPIAVTPTAPGSVLLCGYIDDGADATLAATSLMQNIERGSRDGGGARQPSPPAYAGKGIRACRALLSGAAARSCIRDIVRKANAACRRLPTPRGRASCLREVRLVARRSS